MGDFIFGNLFSETLHNNKPLTIKKAKIYLNRKIFGNFIWFRVEAIPSYVTTFSSYFVIYSNVKLVTSLNPALSLQPC